MNSSPYIYPGLDTKTIPSDLDIILSMVCRVSGVSKGEILSESRKREVVEARQIYCYYARKKTEHSSAKIGNLIGQDHATVLHSIKKVNNMLCINDVAIKSLVNKVNKLFY